MDHVESRGVKLVVDCKNSFNKLTKIFTRATYKQKLEMSMTMYSGSHTPHQILGTNISTIVTQQIFVVIPQFLQLLVLVSLSCQCLFVLVYYFVRIR